MSSGLKSSKMFNLSPHANFLGSFPGKPWDRYLQGSKAVLHERRSTRVARSLKERAALMANLSRASIPGAFQKSAAQFGVAESDYLTMMSLGIHTFESFALRVSSKEELEEFLREVICPGAAYNDPVQGLLKFARTPPIPWQSFKMTDDAASLRKLWFLAKELCKSELERLASGEDASKLKVSVAAATAMEEEAVGRGMPQPISDAERPSLFCLTRLARSLVGPAASYEHVPWEAFISMEEERRMERAGTLPKLKNEVVLSKDQKLSLKEKEDSGMPPGAISDMETMRRRLEVRARAAEMLKLAPHGAYRSLNDRYFGSILAEVPEGMRSPTILEVKRFDRVLHQDILRWLSRDVGTLEEGIKYHLEDHRGKKRAAEETNDLSPLPRRKPPSQDAPKKRCMVCKKRHFPFCKFPEDFRKKMRAAQKEKKSEAKAKAAGAKPAGE